HPIFSANREFPPSELVSVGRRNLSWCSDFLPIPLADFAVNLSIPPSIDFLASSPSTFFPVRAVSVSIPQVDGVSQYQSIDSFLLHLFFHFHHSFHFSPFSFLCLQYSEDSHAPRESQRSTMVVWAGIVVDDDATEKSMGEDEKRAEDEGSEAECDG
ncbi:hypothetical protein PFISCL1PPCAC_23692, partial [Pristionchus fissidentatus]